MRDDQSTIIREFLARVGRKGGIARAAKHGKAALIKWGKKGGRPKGSGKREKP
jgi:hypothetical protein